MIANDNLRLSFSFVFLLVTALTILISTVWVEREDVPVGEYHCAAAVCDGRNDVYGFGQRSGDHFSRSRNAFDCYLRDGGLRKSDLKSNESAMKYFILGSFASAFLLYGMALIYGATGSTNITEIAASVGRSKLSCFAC